MQPKNCLQGLSNTGEQKMKTVSKKEFEQLIKQNPSNNDLKYIIKYTDMKKEAAEVLSSRPEKMIDIIRNR